MSLMLPKDFGKGWLEHVDYKTAPEYSDYGHYLERFNRTHTQQLAEGGFEQHGPSHLHRVSNNIAHGGEDSWANTDAKYTVGGFPRRVGPGMSRAHGFVERTENGLLVHTTWEPSSRSHYGHRFNGYSMESSAPESEEEGAGTHSLTASIKVRHDPKVHGHMAPLNFENRAFEPQSFFDDGDYSHRLEAGPLTPSMHQRALQEISNLKPMSKQEHDLHDHWLLYRHGRLLDHAGPVPKNFDPNNYEEDGHHFGR